MARLTLESPAHRAVTAVDADIACALDGKWHEEERGYGTPCHIWERATNRYGYGVVRFAGKVRTAHRVAWFLATGEWPPHVHHDCRQRPCINKAHLQDSDVGPHTRLHAAESAAKTRLRPGQWSRRHERCTRCGTTERPHHRRGLCDRCSLQAPLPRWSKSYDACTSCGTTSRRHASRGLCDMCRHRRPRHLSHV